MAANYTTFQNVKTVVAGGVSIACPLSIAYSWEDSFIEDACDGFIYPGTQSYGARGRKVTITGRDPVSLFAALGEEGTVSFILSHGSDDTTTTYSLGTGEVVNFSYDSSDTGSLGSGSIDVELIGEPA